MSQQHSSSHTLWLVMGVLAGLAAALLGVMEWPERLNDEVVAVVNDVSIPAQAWQQAVAGLGSERRQPLDAAQRRRVLDRLVDEELLVQHALGQGLPSSDPALRDRLVEAVIESRRQLAAAWVPEEQQLREFHAEHRALFSSEARYRVGLIRLPFTESSDREIARQQAAEVAAALNSGEDFSALQAAHHKGGALLLPDVPLPREKLLDYLGGKLTARVLALRPGQASEPVQMGKAWQVLVLRERQDIGSEGLEAARAQVIAEMRRRRAESLLQTLLEELRAEHAVRINESLLDGPAVDGS